jgi:hypothetical protein
MSMAPYRTTSSLRGSVSPTTMFSNSDVIDFRPGVVLDTSAVPNLSSSPDTAHLDASNISDQTAILTDGQDVMANRVGPCQTQAAGYDQNELMKAVRAVMAEITPVKSEMSPSTTYQARPATTTYKARPATTTYTARPATTTYNASPETDITREKISAIVKSVLDGQLNSSMKPAASQERATSRDSNSYKDMLLRRGLRAPRDIPDTRSSRVSATTVENVVRTAIAKHMPNAQGFQQSRNEKMSSVLY